MEEFVDQVEKALHEVSNSADLINKRLHCAEENSVEKMAKIRIGYLETAPKTK